MSSGYYDPAPLLLLERPLCLTALPGVGHRRVARAVAALTGLPLADLDRRLEHDLGRSRWLAAGELGAARLDAAEDRVVSVALRERPCAVVALGDGALLPGARAERILAEGLLVSLETDPSDAFWRLRRRERGEWSPYLAEPVGHVGEIADFLAARSDALARAPVRIDIRGLPFGEVVRRVQAVLPERLEE